MVAFVALRKVIMGVKQSQFGKCQKFDPDLVLDLIDNLIGNTAIHCVTLITEDFSISCVSAVIAFGEMRW